MTPKKTPRANLENKKALFFEVGLIVSLVLMILVFASGREKIRFTEPPVADLEPYVPTMMPITTQDQKRATASPPPAVKGLVLTIVENEMKIETSEFKFDEPGDIGIFFSANGGTGGGNYGTIQLDDDPLFFVEDMPKFQGGDLAKFREWVLKKVSYPAMAQQLGIKGKVTLSFVIEKDGSLSNIEVISSPDKLLANEAVRVLGQSPAWTPGYQNDMPARVKFTIPIDFIIK